jgi:signal transduction histidine kinase
MDGDVMGWWDVSLGPIFGKDGTVKHFIGIGTNITERKLAEKETIRVAQLTSVGELAAGVAYEINNPLNGIINYAEILASKVNEEKQKDVAERIIVEGDRISRIVRSLLAFTVQEDGEKRSVRVEDLISMVLDLVSSQMANDGIEVNVKLSPDLPYVRVSPQDIEQVFLGVIANARDAINGKAYSDSENKCIDIEGSTVSLDGNGFVQVVFTDNGTGMPVDVVERAMSPFFTTKGRKGTGLGLSISQSIINEHDGKMKIESEEGKFTRVTIYLLAGRGSDTA